MEKALYYIFHNLYTIRLLFSGMYDMETRREDDLIINPRIKNLSVSGVGDDKNNLKSDRVKVLKDYSKSYKQKAKEHTPELANCQ